MDEDKPQYFRCACCECYHPVGFYGDCRDDANRFNEDELDENYGVFGWEEVDHA